jgi:hypothetical protein
MRWRRFEVVALFDEPFHELRSPRIVRSSDDDIMARAQGRSKRVHPSVMLIVGVFPKGGGLGHTGL